MKKLLALCCLLVGLLPLTKAQSIDHDLDSLPKEKSTESKWYVGLHVDHIYRNVNGGKYKGRANLLVGYQFHPRIALQSGFSYSNQDRLLTGIIAGPPNQMILQHTFEIPIGLRFDLRGPDKKWTPYVLAGLRNQVVMFRSSDLQGTHDFRLQPFLEVGIRYKPTRNLDVILNGGWGGNFGFIGGLGLNYKIGPKRKGPKIKN